MDRLSILAPALLGITVWLMLFALYSVLYVLGRVPTLADGKSSQTLGPFLTGSLMWLIRPIEHLFVVRGVSPNAITFASLLLCVASGAAIGAGYLATGAWLYVGAGITDILDGRIARATGKQTKAGALFDSVCDRWGELAVFAGCAWYLRDSGWLMALMLAVAGSMMVSYTRARGEGLGLQLASGLMQRAERIIMVAVGLMVAAWFAATPAQERYASLSIGTALILCGGLASVTAIGRLIEGYRVLLAREPAAAMIETKVRTDARITRPEPVPVPAIDNPMRVTGEHTA